MHRYERHVRLKDLDWMQHVNNVRMLEIVEEAHFEMFYRGESTETSDSIVPRFVIVRHEVNYRSALTFQKHPVMVDTEVVEFRAAQYKLISSVHDTQNTYCTVLTNAVAVSSETQRVRRLSETEKDFLAQHLSASVDVN